MVLGFGNKYSQGQQIKIPKGKTILIDGKVQKTEWDDSEVVFVSDSITLNLKADMEYIYLAIQVAEGKNAIADLYCTTGTDIINLHASAKLGQRILKNEKWPDWNWWNNDLWTANVSRVESFEHRTFLKENVREFQVSKQFFSASNTKFFFEVTYLSMSRVTSAVPYPSNAIKSKTGNWLNLTWE